MRDIERQEGWKMDSRAALRLFLTALLAVSIAGCGATPAGQAGVVASPQPSATVAPAAAAAGATYKIGFLASVTGKAAALGEPERNVAVMLQEQLDAAGGVVGPTVCGTRWRSSFRTRRAAPTRR